NCPDGTVTINGTVSADGEAGYGASDYTGGGGSGGSIWVIANSIAGSGTITANGGNGADQINADGGGGAGGRVHIKYTTANFSGRISVSGGSGPDWATDGQQGSVWVEPTVAGNVEFSLSPVSATIGSHHSGSAFIKSSFTALYVRMVTGDSILGNTNITAKDSIAIQGSALVSANLKGYDASYGTGQGADGVQYNGAGGAGYGGEGGDGEEALAGGVAYDDSTQPDNIGSGGGHGSSSYSYPGGAGGGRIKFNCPDGTVTINGTVSADGEAGYGASDYTGGGGSGGSIWVIANSIAGSGSSYTHN
ncbi:MAG: hypothetical protein HY769_07865, partial [Candidatus Stahlbacteria bacterium]|nr:hypothetical protein [Candidatus Stahlbacteria bacterium]